MINRTILKQIELSVKCRPITLITGARQVGKSTLAQTFIKKGFAYVSLDDPREREAAVSDPELFLQVHPWPLIIDEVQKAPILFDVIESIVNKEKLNNPQNYGMYILTGFQAYSLMKNVSESMAGRVSIIHMAPLSRNEILARDEPKFDFDPLKISARAKANPLPIAELYKIIVKGFYPELYSNELLDPEKFYSDYVEAYIERDVSDFIGLKNKLAFRRFMELLASLTGQELIYDNIAKLIGVDSKTIVSWVSVLMAGDIVHLLEPYHEYSITKRVVRRPKIYFSDTGLACYLTRASAPEILQSSFLSGRFVETYIVNEIRKTYLNNGKRPNFYYYRDNNMNEVDLLILEDGKLHCLECKSGISYTKKDIKAFKCLQQSNYEKGANALVCATPTLYTLEENAYAFPMAGI